MAIITLLTDFGVQDEYVGVLKGVILDRNPGAVIVDISHGIDAQDIAAAAHALKAAYPYFPVGTVHAVVVDPGVGTGRDILAAEGDGHCFIAPDNGLLGPVLGGCASPSIYRLENELLFRQPVSNTFHGRDIIAPVAAHLASGLSMGDLGPAVALNDIQMLKNAGAVRITPRQIEGRIISIDRFGNLMTNIRSDDLAVLGAGPFWIDVGDIRIRGLVTAYAQGEPRKPLALISSRNTVEIAVREGNAARRLNIDKGAVVRVAADCGKPELPGPPNGKQRTT